MVKNYDENLVPSPDVLCVTVVLLVFQMRPYFTNHVLRYDVGGITDQLSHGTSLVPISFNSHLFSYIYPYTLILKLQKITLQEGAAHNISHRQKGGREFGRYGHLLTKGEGG